MNRRKFLKSSALGVSALSMGRGIAEITEAGTLLDGFAGNNSLVVGAKWESLNPDTGKSKTER